MSQEKKRRTVTLTYDEKFKIIDYVEKNNDRTQRDMAAELRIPASTLSTIMRKKEKIADDIRQGQAQCRRKRPCEYPDIEKALLVWVKMCQDKGIPLNGPIMRNKAKDLANELGRTDFCASNGWLDKFKKRHPTVFRTTSTDSNQLHSEANVAVEQKEIEEPQGEVLDTPIEEILFICINENSEENYSEQSELAKEVNNSQQNLTSNEQVEVPCIIYDLIQTPFIQRSHSKKCEIVKKGRPSPPISDLEKDDINNSVVIQYRKTEWLTGSKYLNRLFCWPCLLFENDSSQIWSKIGFDNLNSLSSSITKHEKAVDHIKSIIQLNTFIHTIDNNNNNNRILENQYNEKITKNREILKRLIDVIMFFGKQKQHFKRNLDSDYYCNDLLEFIRQYDPILNSEWAAEFSENFLSIRNGLINSISFLILEKIRKNLFSTNFVSIIFANIRNNSNIFTVLRYVDPVGNIRENFLGFVDPNTNPLQNMKSFLKKFYCEKKLIAYTYDGATIQTGKIIDCNRLIENLYPSAIFVHCYSNLLNLTLQESISAEIRECKYFSQTLFALLKFFAKRKAADKLHRKLPEIFSYEFVKILEEDVELFIEFFKNFDDETVVQARGFINFFKNFKIQFFLKLLSDIYSLTDVLEKSPNHVQVNYVIEKLIDLRKNGFDRIWTNVDQENYRKRQNFKSLFSEILNNVLIQIEERFKHTEQLRFTNLLDCNFFKKFNEEFPEIELKCLDNLYGKFFDIFRLKNELTVLYSLAEFQNLSVDQLLNFIYNNELSKGLKEVQKLATLIVTIPVKEHNFENSDSVFQRVNEFCDSTDEQELTNSLAILCVENKVVETLKSSPSFYHDVIENFLKTNPMPEFIYK